MFLDASTVSGGVRSVVWYVRPEISRFRARIWDGQPLVAQLPNEEIEGVSAGRHLFANLRNPKVFARDQADLATVGESEPIAIADAAAG
jgi:hypothetical protein